MKRYIRQNRIQKELIKLSSLFSRDYSKINELENKGINVYTPRVNKLKLGFISILLVGCLITPATNIFILPLVKWGMK